jgi:amidohydrolase
MRRSNGGKKSKPKDVRVLMRARGPVRREELVALRRDIHRHPEIGFEEKRTSKLVQTHLRELGLKPRVLAGTGVTALVPGGKTGRTLMIRCDLDALPMQEENTHAYRSVHEGAMHACGHDLHTAILLGTAKSLVQAPPERGRVKLNFQPAEEGLNGAGRMIDEGIMENPKVDGVLGYHIWQEIPVGKIGVVTGPAMAAVDRFHIKVTGKGGHAAYPQGSIDPVLVSAHIVTALQSIVSRNVDPLHAAVVTVGRIHAGTAFNIIPPEAQLEGTCRTFTKEAGRLVPKRLKEIAQGVARSLGARAEVEVVREHESLVNDARMAEFMREVARDVVGKRNVVDAEPSMGGEDHAAYQAMAPGCYSFFGAGNRKGPVYPHHHPLFNPSEDVMEIGVAILAEAARRWLGPAA